jgi:hypothetical protein
LPERLSTSSSSLLQPPIAINELAEGKQMRVGECTHSLLRGTLILFHESIITWFHSDIGDDTPEYASTTTSIFNAYDGCPKRGPGQQRTVLRLDYDVDAYYPVLDIKTRG